VIEVPSWYRRAIEPAGLTGLAWLTEVDRVLCVGVWIWLTRRIHRIPRDLRRHSV
jgi:hypothetical protein